MSITVDYQDLEHALYWVSSAPDFDAEAFFSRSTGKFWCSNADGPVDKDFPDDVEDGTEYLKFPHKNDLDLGRDLVYRFITDQVPHLERKTRDLFRHRGAYSRFKGLLSKEGHLQSWYDYENRATRVALEQWATEYGFTVRHASSAA